MSLRARSRWTWARASSPLIHFDSPEGSAMRDLAVDRQSQLERDPRPAQGQAGEEAAKACPRRLGADPDPDLDPGLAQRAEAQSRRARVGVLNRGDDAGDSGLGDAGRASRATLADMGAGLERRVERGAPRVSAGLA
jgi:hypothetical protein